MYHDIVIDQIEATFHSPQPFPSQITPMDTIDGMRTFVLL